MSNSVRHYPGYGCSLVQSLRHPGPQYLAIGIRKAKCARLGYETRLSRLYTLDPPLALAFLKGSHSTTLAFEQESSHGMPDRSQVHQLDLLAAPGLHNTN
jgi:hypothetical protein